MNDTIKPLVLIPDNPPVYEDTQMALDGLPGDWALDGEPSPELCAQVKKWGVIQAVTLTALAPPRDLNEYFRVDDGRRRIKAARRAGLITIPAHVYPSGTPMGDVLTIMLNQTTSDNPLADLAAIERLMDRGATMDEIRLATGMPIGTIRKRLRLRNLHPDLRKAVIAGRMKIATAEAASKLTRSKQEQLLAETQGQRRIRGVDVKHATRVVAAEAVATLPTRLFEDASPQPGARLSSLLDEIKRSVPIAEHLAYLNSLAVAWHIRCFIDDGTE